MEVVPIAFESLGVRSQATLVETRDVRILVDPAVSLAPRRYGLPPHQLEVDRLKELASKVYHAATEADVLVVTHYHYDHHDPGFVIPTSIYAGKAVLIKDPRRDVNRSQRVFRAPKFLKAIEGLPRSLESADGREFRFGGTTVKFSRAVPHGSDERMGYVVQVLVKDGDGSVLITSDVEGAPREAHLEFTRETKPNDVIVDGPLSYMLGHALSEEDLHRSIKNMEAMVREGLSRFVVDHHVLRDPMAEERLAPVRDVAMDLGVKFLNAAQFLGVEPVILEAKRRELYSRDNRRGDLSGLSLLE
ncbi:MBL fold metallo-hydrolase [Sulfodiicoccus acidiphilus]|uniref:MBL fold metallo-hydrolase n=1 Tax=Sulfodiicoccus acidiphilus TaxID=1670455 RepID=UPI000F824D43|nr:MBL fold metallo-hydrolase [Sulfodiicoccus acidiphilus]